MSAWFGCSLTSTIYATTPMKLIDCNALVSFGFVKWAEDPAPAR
jgi:hypothetical protein